MALVGAELGFEGLKAAGLIAPLPAIEAGNADGAAIRVRNVVSRCGNILTQLMFGLGRALAQDRQDKGVAEEGYFSAYLFRIE